MDLTVFQNYIQDNLIHHNLSQKQMKKILECYFTLMAENAEREELMSRPDILKYYKAMNPVMFDNVYRARWGHDEWTFHGQQILEYIRSNPKLGSVTPIRDFEFTYLGSHRFRNTRTDSSVSKFEFGRNHVSIGFVDLQDLLFGEFYGDPGLETAFLMIDQDEIAVARTLVIYQMIRQDMANEHILQCWYSTIWSKGAFDEFQRACKIVIERENERKIGKRVMDYIKTWSKMGRVDVKKFLDDIYVPKVELSTLFRAVMFRNMQDRKDFVDYHINGSIFVDGSEFTGNLTLAHLNDNLYLAISSIYQIFPWNEISKSKNFSNKTTLKEIMTDHFNEKLTNLKIRLINNNTKCTFLHQTFDLANPDVDLIKQIQSLRPKTISWSNVPEYWNKMEFLKIAKKLSNFETINVFHVMMAYQKVYGVQIFDYINRLNEKRIEQFVHEMGTRVLSISNGIFE